MKKYYLNNNSATRLDVYAEGYSPVEILVDSEDYTVETGVYTGNLYSTDNQSELFFYSNEMIRDFMKSKKYGFKNYFSPRRDGNFAETNPSIWKPEINNFYFFYEELYYQGSSQTNPRVAANLPLMTNPIPAFNYVLNTLNLNTGSLAFTFYDVTHTMIPRIPYIKGNKNLPVCLTYYMTDTYLTKMKNQKAFALKDPETGKTIKYCYSDNLPFGVGVRYNSISLDNFINWFDKAFNFDQPITPQNPETDTLRKDVKMSFNVNSAFVDEWLGYGDHLLLDVEDVSEWYVSWTNDYNIWQCQPVRGKSMINKSYERVITTDNNDVETVQLVQETPKFDLYSDYLTDREYKEWESIERSKYIYLYNTKADEGFWVKSNNTSSSLKNYNNSGMISYHLNLSLNTKINY